VFALEQLGGTGGLIDGHPEQAISQIKGLAIVLAYDVVVSLIILKLIDWTIGLRVAKEVEMEGLDLSLHGEVVQ